MSALLGVVGLMGTGGGGALDTETVTVGTSTDGGTYFAYGYSTIYGIGSSSNGTFAPKSASITNLYWEAFTQTLLFIVNGTQTNADWTKMTIGGVDYLRSSASFANIAGPATRWFWTSVSSNPFASSPTTVTFT